MFESILKLFIALNRAVSGDLAAAIAGPAALRGQAAPPGGAAQSPAFTAAISFL